MQFLDAERCYDRLRGHRTSRRTLSGRFTELDRVLAEEIDKRFSGPVSVHDMAASNAITSLELYQMLARSHPVTMRASDWNDAVYLVGSTALDADGPRFKRNFPSVLAHIAHRMGLSRRMSLFDPAALRLAAGDQNFRLARENFFFPLPAQYDVVRVMNALTLLNFPRDRLELALKAVMPTVAESGLLIIGRCVEEEDGHIEATMFAKKDGRFSTLRQFGAGYPLAAAITNAD